MNVSWPNRWHTTGMLSAIHPRTRYGLNSGLWLPVSSSLLPHTTHSMQPGFIKIHIETNPSTIHTAPPSSPLLLLLLLTWCTIDVPLHSTGSSCWYTDTRRPPRSLPPPVPLPSIIKLPPDACTYSEHITKKTINAKPWCCCRAFLLSITQTKREHKPASCITSPHNAQALQFSLRPSLDTTSTLFCSLGSYVCSRLSYHLCSRAGHAYVYYDSSIASRVYVNKSLHDTLYVCWGWTGVSGRVNFRWVFFSFLFFLFSLAWIIAFMCFFPSLFSVYFDKRRVAGAPHSCGFASLSFLLLLAAVGGRRLLYFTQRVELMLWNSKAISPLSLPPLQCACLFSSRSIERSKCTHVHTHTSANVQR